MAGVSDASAATIEYRPNCREVHLCRAMRDCHDRLDHRAFVVRYEDRTLAILLAALDGVPTAQVVPRHERARELKSGEIGILRMAATPQVIEILLAPFLVGHRHRHSGVEVHLVEGGALDCTAVSNTARPISAFWRPAPRFRRLHCQARSRHQDLPRSQPRQRTTTTSSSRSDPSASKNEVRSNLCHRF